MWILCVLMCGSLRDGVPRSLRCYSRTCLRGCASRAGVFHALHALQSLRRVPVVSSAYSIIMLLGRCAV